MSRCTGAPSADPSTTPLLRFGFAQDDKGTSAKTGAASRAVWTRAEPVILSGAQRSRFSMSVLQYVSVSKGITLIFSYIPFAFFALSFASFALKFRSWNQLRNLLTAWEFKREEREEGAKGATLSQVGPKLHFSVPLSRKNCRSKEEKLLRERGQG